MQPWQPWIQHTLGRNAEQGCCNDSSWHHCAANCLSLCTDGPQAGSSDEMQTYSINTSFSVPCILLRSVLFFTSVKSTLTDACNFFLLQSHLQAIVILEWGRHFFSMVLFPDTFSVILYSLAFLAFWARKSLISCCFAFILCSFPI